ncbi:MAG: efflux RND transporter periplasmic adaptor subunit [Tannerellaceae bacterium]|nr:efflux RND transporter periplasmic adaptor subunit [Tannerellaceae bacterium]
MSIKNLLLFIAAATIYSCSSNNRTDSAEQKTFTTEGEYISVSSTSPILQNIQIEEVATTDYKVSFTTSGVVRAIPSRYAEIGSPFAGRVVKSFVKLGQKVSSGSPVFEIHSPSFYETCKQYQQAKQEMELALKSLNRERDLRSNGIGSVKSLEEAEVNYELQKQEYELAVAALDVYQIKTEEISQGLPLIIRSPIAGEVVKEHIVTGQYIREDADALAIVADLGKVWVSAHVKEKDIPFVRQDAEIEIALIALPERKIKGTIYHIGDLLDEDTRSVEVMIECDNPSLTMKPAMYGTVTFTNVPMKTIAVPRSAVLQSEDERYVLVSDGENRFRKVAITVASEEKSGLVPVLSGVKAGDRIVSKGAFYFINAR